MQRARDELAAALLAAETRAAEAEEEQLAAEQQAAALAQQLQQLQRAGEAAAAAGGGGAAPPAAAEQQPPEAAAARRHQRSEEEQADAEVLLAALDQERQRSEELVRLVEAAEREAVAATERCMWAQQQADKWKAKAKGKKAPGADSVPASLDGLDGGEAAEALQQRIAALKASRDKLIAAFDAQAAEIERLSTDNAALAEVDRGWGAGWVVGLAGRHELPYRCLVPWFNCSASKCRCAAAAACAH